MAVDSLNEFATKFDPMFSDRFKKSINVQWDKSCE